MYLDCFEQLSRGRLRPGRFLALLLAAGSLVLLPAAQVSGPFASVRGVAYPGYGRALPEAACLYARDLPLIALMGANTVRTYGLVPERGRTFTAVLESTGLDWLAGFPLDSFYDPSRTLASQQEQVLTAFQRYARRFRGERRLIGYVLGEDVTTDYARKFAGPPSDYVRLLEAAAAMLTAMDLPHAPALGAGVRDAALIEAGAAGISFWVWNGSADALTAIHAGRPVLVSQAGAAGAESDLPGMFASFTGEQGLFTTAPAGQTGFDTLTPSRIYYRLAGLWRGTFPASWRDPDAPALARPSGSASPGALIQFSGSALVEAATPYSDESWPYSLATACVCVGSAPARLSYLAPGVVTAQVPQNATPGPRSVVFYRGGQASNVVELHVAELSTVTFAGPVIEARR